MGFKSKRRIALLVMALFVLPVSVRSGEPSTVGEWGARLDWPSVSVHSHLLPNGQVLFWPYSDAISLWSPQTELTSAATISGRNIFCSGHAFTEDGKLIVMGGHMNNNVGLDSASMYDPAADSWSSIPDMNLGRWYPSVTTLANGDILVLSGDDNLVNNQLPQIYRPTTNTWRNLTAAELSLPLYPRTFLAPNGYVFVATAFSRYLDTSGTGRWISVASRLDASRDNYGSAAMYDDGKVLWCGGGDPPTATCEIIDLGVSTPHWQFTGSMAQPRRQCNLTILPDGKVLASGGSSTAGFNEPSGAVLQPEIWDPATDQWTVMAGEERYRGYHSTAVLLPDGRVLSSGGDEQPNAQVFLPPYLATETPRPTIGSAPQSSGAGQTFFVGTPSAASIAKVNLLRLGSVTHAMNWNQRIARLSFTQVPGGLDVTTPANKNLLPPGHYMLFLIDNNGVPSVASMLSIASGEIPFAGSVSGGAGSPGPALTLDRLAGGDLSLSWNASCTATDDDYEIYSGTLGDFTSHVPEVCSTQGSTTRTLSPTPGDRYYLVVPRNDSAEGSYGTDSDATERPRGGASCRAQAIGLCR